MQQGKHIAQKTAEMVLKAFPETVRWMERYKRGPDLLPACLVPSSDVFSYAIVHDGLEAHKGMEKLSALHNILSWRYSPCIYRFDPDLYQAITQTGLGNNIRPEAFYTLPAWGIYVETPDFPPTEDEYRSPGFFAALSDDSRQSGYGVELRLSFVLPKNGGTILTLPVPLVDGTVEDCMAALSASANTTLQQLDGRDFAGLFHAKTARDLVVTESLLQDIGHCLSLILYLCSEEPDTAAPRVRQAPLTNKQGHRILPALQPQTWDVGLRFGAAYRAYQSQKSRNDTQGTGGQKRPHIRRAHWHGFWYGAKADAAKREFRLRWVAPTMFGGNLDNLPATVHKVTAP